MASYVRAEDIPDEIAQFNLIKEVNMKYINTWLLSSIAVVLTALVTTTAGQVFLAVVTSKLYTWFVGEPFYMTIWNNPWILLEVWF